MSGYRLCTVDRENDVRTEARINVIEERRLAVFVMPSFMNAIAVRVKLRFFRLFPSEFGEFQRAFLRVPRAFFF